jgi:hypothetical protein
VRGRERKGKGVVETGELENSKAIRFRSKRLATQQQTKQRNTKQILLQMQTILRLSKGRNSPHLTLQLITYYHLLHSQ